MPRGHARTDSNGNVARSAISVTINTWINYALRWGLVAIFVAVGISAATCVYGHREPSVLDAYAIVCAVRLAVDLVARTYYSGVYALERVHRPLYTILITDPVGLFLVLALFPYLGIWCFPVGLTATVILSRGLSIYYTSRKYALLRSPTPRIRLLARRGRKGARAKREWGLVLRAGTANLSSRVGSLLVWVRFFGRCSMAATRASSCWRSISRRRCSGPPGIGRRFSITTSNGSKTTRTRCYAVGSTRFARYGPSRGVWSLGRGGHRGRSDLARVGGHHVARRSPSRFPRALVSRNTAAARLRARAIFEICSPARPFCACSSGAFSCGVATTTC